MTGILIACTIALMAQNYPNNAPFLLEEEKVMLDEINLVRSNPRAYVPHIERYIQTINMDADFSAAYQQKETAAARELINELNRIGTLSILQPHPGLYNAAVRHGNDIARQGRLNHVGSDGSQIWDRLASVQGVIAGAENLVAGGHSERESVIILLVDSGSSNRGHRRNLLNPKWEYAAPHIIGNIGGYPNAWIQLFGDSGAMEFSSRSGYSSPTYSKITDKTTNYSSHYNAYGTYRNSNNNGGYYNANNRSNDTYTPAPYNNTRNNNGYYNTQNNNNYNSNGYNKTGEIFVGRNNNQQQNNWSGQNNRYGDHYAYNQNDYSNTNPSSYEQNNRFGNNWNNDAGTNGGSYYSNSSSSSSSSYNPNDRYNNNSYNPYSNNSNNNNNRFNNNSSYNNPYSNFRDTRPMGSRSYSDDASEDFGESTAADLNKAKGNVPAFMKSGEMAMIEEINLMRSSPRQYVRYIHEYIDNFRNSGWDAATVQEEVSTANELIAELQRLPRLSQLEPHEGLHEVAIRHGKDIQRQGVIVHVGSDGSWPWDRVQQATDLKDAGENLVGGGTNVRESVIMLLVDSGIPNRGHRKALLDPKWEYVACYEVGMVGPQNDTWVQVFAK